MNLYVLYVTEALFDVFQNPIATNSENCIFNARRICVARALTLKTKLYLILLSTNIFKAN